MARPIVLRMSVEDADKVRKSLEGVGVAGERMLVNLEKAAKAAATNDNGGLRALQAGTDSLRSSLDALAGRLGPIGAALSGFGPAGTAGAAAVTGLAVAAVKVAQAGDEMTQSFARVKIAVGGVDAARDTMAKLFALSQQSGVAMKDTVDTFVRLQRAAADLGATRTEVAQVVSNIQKLTAASGATGQEVAAGMVQIGQALASGRLQGDELRSILENMPPVARAIAEEFNVSVGELRKLGSEGQITSDRVFKALLKTTEEANRQFGEMPDTLDKALTRVGNAWTARLADIDRQVQASKFFQYLLNGVAGSISPDNSEDALSRRLESLRADFAKAEGFWNKTTGGVPGILSGARDSQAAEIASLENRLGRAGLATMRDAENEIRVANEKKAENAETAAKKQAELAAGLIDEARTRARLVELAEDQRRIEEARLKAADDIEKAGIEMGSVQARLVEEEYIRAAQAENAARATEKANKLAEESVKAAERQRAVEEKREVALDQFIAKLEEEARVSGETSAEREISRALLEAQGKLLDDQGRAMRDLTDLERERISNAIRQKDALEEQRKAAEKFARDLERTITRSTDRAVDFAADALYDGFTGKITSIGDFLKTTLLRAAAQAMAEMVLRPIIAPIVSAGVTAAVGGGLGQIFGIGGAGAAGAAAGAGGSLGNLASAGGLGYSIAQSLGLGGSSFQAAGEVAASGASASMLGASEGLGGILAAAAPYLSIAGGALGIYNAIKDPTPTNIVAGLGGAYAGTSAALSLAGLSALPFAGPIGIAAAAVGLLGSLFGGKKGKPVVHANQTGRTMIFGPDGSTQDLGGLTGYYGASPSSYDYIADVGQSIRATIKALGGTAPGFGLAANYDSITKPNGEGALLFTDAQGRWGDAYSPRPGEVIGVGEQMAVDALKRLIPLSQGIDAVYTAVARNSAATKIEDFAKDLDFAKNLKDSVAAIADLGQALEQVSAKAKATAVAMVASFDETMTRAESLGIGDTANAAIAKTIRDWMGSQGPQIQPSAVQTMLAQIDGAFAGIAEAAKKYGIGEAEVKAANDNAVQKVRDQFSDQIAAILDPAGAALRAFDKSADQMRQDARDLGVDLVDVERAIAKQRQAVADQALGGLSTSIRQFLDGQSLGATSSLSPEARLVEAQRQFEANLSGARAGDVYASSQLVGSANTLLGEGRAFYGSTADYAALESFTRDSLRNFGSQQGWEGFAPALQSQTTTLVNAQALATQAIVNELKSLRDDNARLQLRISQLLSQVA